MLNQAFISKLKQNNVSKDAEKTILRISKLWKESSSKRKKEIIELGDTNSSSVYRVTRIGNASAKIILAFAEICNVNPYYLTGETDELTKCTNAVIIKFLNKLGYGDLAAALTKKTLKDSNEAEETIVDDIGQAVDTQKDENVQENTMPEINIEKSEIIDEKTSHITAECEHSCLCDLDIVTSMIDMYVSNRDKMTDPQITTIRELTSDDIDCLLKAINIKAKADGKFTVIYDMIKLMLIS